MTGGWRRVAWWCGLAAVLALAAWVRLASWRAVFWAGEVLPQVDGDSAYHLHRILEAIRRFPHVPTFDPWTNWPAGAACPWTDGFDLAAAAFALALGGGRSAAAAQALIATFPAVLGLVVVAATVRLARRLGAGRAAALAAGAGAALVPVLVQNSQLGRVDHHVAEALLVVAFTGWGLDLLELDVAAPRRALGIEVTGALLSAGAMYVFSGGVLYVAVGAAAALLVALGRPGRPAWVGSGAPGLLAGAVLAAALTAPAIAEHHRALSYSFPSLFQPALCAVAGLGVGSAVAVARARPAARWSVRLALLATAGAAAAALLAVVAPSFAREVVAGLSGWLLHRDPWLKDILEFHPLFRARGLTPTQATHLLLGWAGFVAPAAIAVATWAVARRGRARAWIFGANATFFLLLAVEQLRFTTVVAPLLAIAVALAAEALARAFAGSSRFAPAAAPAVALLLVAAYALDGPSRALLSPRRATGPDAFQAAALDLRDAAPVVPGGRAGVAVGWSWGHVVRLLGRRPVVANGFGTYLDERSFWELQGALLGTPAGLEAFMERHDLGYLVAGPVTLERLNADGPPTDGDRPFVDGRIHPAFMRERPLGPLAIGGSGLPATGVPHLEHFLPRFASRQPVAGLRFATPALWAFERVPGARLVGEGAPGARVVAELPFVENGRPHRWKAWADVGPEGRFSVTVPVPSGWTRPTLGTGEAWEVRVGDGEPVKVAVPERAVREGREIVAAPAPGSRGLARRR